MSNLPPEVERSLDRLHHFHHADLRHVIEVANQRIIESEAERDRYKAQRDWLAGRLAADGDMRPGWPDKDEWIQTAAEEATDE